MKNQNFQFLLKLLLVLILVSSLSCQENGKNETTGADSFYTIPFDEIINNQREVKLSEIAADVELIQFENTPDAYLGLFENIEFTKDYFFVQCWDQPIQQFSRSGKFIKHIGARGRGPGEYNNCMKMSIDEKNERVYIHTNQLNIMVFNFDGEYIKTIEFTALERFMNFWICGRDSTLVSYFEPFEGKAPYIFTEYNEKGDTLQGISNYIFFNINERAEIPHTLPYSPEQNYSYRFANNLHLKSSYNDTVYTYDASNKFAPKFFIDLGKHKLPVDLIYERKWNRPLPDDLCWTGVHETSDYIFIPYGYHYDLNKPESEREEKGLVLYNKKTKEGVAVSETRQGGLIDDVLGGPDFKPYLTSNNEAIMLVSALDMKQYLESDEFKNMEVKSPEKKEKLNQLKKTINEDDNHFVVSLKLKE